MKFFSPKTRFTCFFSVSLPLIFYKPTIIVIMKNFLRVLFLSVFCCGIVFSAQAQCDPETIPYSIDFESCYTGINSFPDCWTKMQDNNNYPYPVLQGIEQCLAFNGYCIAALPEMSVPLNGLRISFDLSVQNTGNRIVISVIDFPDWSQSTSMVNIDTITLAMTGMVYHQEVHFDSYTGSGRYILIQHEGNAVSYIDNVLVDEMPDCLNPVNVQATGITSQAATLNWTEAGTATQWRVLRSTTPITNFAGTNPSTVNNPTITYNNLSPNTTYYFYVQSVCGGDYSAWSSTIFTTICGTASLPLQEGFTYGEMPACWSFQQVTGSSTMNFVASGQNPFVSPAAGSAMAQWASGSYQSGRQGRLVSPEISTVGTNVLDVNFKWYHGSENPEAVTEGVQVQYSFDGTTWNNAPQGLIPRYHNALSGWTDYDVMIPAAGAHSSVYVGFLFTAGGGRNCYIDEVNLRAASGCLAPANLAASDVTGNGATITWTEVGSANNWQIVVSDVPLANPSSATPTNVSSTTYNLQNLNPLTTYYLYVRSSCSTNNYSEWSHVLSFTTGCGTVMNLPYCENFDDYGTGSNAFPACWSRPATSYYQSSITPSISDISSVNGDNSLLFCTGSSMQTYAISPAIGTEIHDLSLSMYLYFEDANLSGSLEVGVMSNPSDYATFEHVASFSADAAGVWSFETVSFENTALTGSGRYIAFRHNGVSDFNYCMMDELVILLHTDCWPAQHIAVSGVSGNQATLTWDNVNGSDVAWHLKMAEYPLADPSGYANVLDTLIQSEVFHINYLNGGTTYYYYLQPVCGNDDFGTWQSGSFTTDPCNCFVRIIMHDQYGDGWNGAKIQMKRGNTVIAEITLESGSLDTAIVYTCEAGNIDYYFVGSPVQSSYDAEISFEIENNYGMQIYASSGTPVAGSFTHNSPSCGVDCSAVPANVNAVTISGGRATVCWNAVPAAQSYTIYRNGEVVAEYIPNTCCTVPTVEGENCFTVAGVCIVGESSPSAPSCVVGVHEYESSVAVRIFPNPANDKVVVESDSPFTRVEVCNLLGQTIHADSFNTSVNRTEMALPYSTGIYLVKVWCGNQCSVSKLVIQK